ncbi:DUF2779 domain-containing protein [Mycoplasmopsis ciconiae]|uniref:DUF2779 domain-containing protein n=1 Tax=Mycoplasmopsis ciconiae TaxID=561067 RepID=A0ABU7MKW9_9BACT|nr:DUF2779 domain-containing protein [Mycoplasmopsis ciconiae]
MKQQKNEITWSVFKRYINLGEFFTWNNPSEYLVQIYNQKHKTNLSYDNLKDKYIDSLEEDISDDELFGGILDIDSEENKQTQNNIESRIFQIYKQKAVDFYIQKYQINNTQVEYISPKTSSNIYTATQAKALLTKQALENPQIQLIVDPVFYYDLNDHFLVKTSFLIFDKTQNKIVNLKFSSGMQISEFHKSFFDYYTLRKTTNIPEIKSISYINIDPLKTANLDVSKQQIPFYESFSSVFSASKSDKTETEKKQEVFYAKDDFILKRTGDIFAKSLLFGAIVNYDFLYIVKNNLKNNSARLTKNKENNTFNYQNYFHNDKYETKPLLGTYSEVIAKIQESFIYKDYSVEKFENYINQIDFLSSKDNPFKKEIKILILVALFGDQAPLLSFGYKKTQKIEVPLDEYLKIYDDFSNKRNNYFRVSTLNVIKQLHQKDAKIVWYDYEGFSSVLPPLDYYPSHRQVLNQVSIVKTINGKEIDNHNYVYDTKKIKLQDLVEIIEHVYSDKSDYYVVFNRNYENSRNREISKVVEKSLKNAQRYLQDNNDANVILDNLENDLAFYKYFYNKYSDVYQFKNKVNHINDNTIDLADVFKSVPKNSIYLPENNGFKDLKYFLIKDADIVETQENEIDKSKYFLGEKYHIFFRELLSYYSIKKIEHLITDSNVSLPQKIKEYKKLRIQKGTMAMEEAIRRYENLTSDSQWEDISYYLAEYCENDVRAMIMVYDFIMFVAKKLFSNICDYEYKIEAEDINSKNYTYIDGLLKFQ